MPDPHTPDPHTPPPNQPLRVKIGFGTLRPVVALPPTLADTASDFRQHFALADAPPGSPFTHTLLPAGGATVAGLDVSDGEFADDELLRVGALFVCVVSDKSGARESEVWFYRDRAEAEAAHDHSTNAHMY